MGSRTAGVTDVAPGAGVVEVDTVERASPDLTTTTTADPTAVGSTLAVTSAARFPSTNGFKVRVESEVMLITAGAGTLSWTVTRGQDNTTAAAHTTGMTVAQVVAVQRVEPVEATRQVSFAGRAATFRTPGRAGTTGQKILALHNATTSTVLVDLHKITVDLAVTAAKLVTVLPPFIELHRFTAVPTGGTALAKVPDDTALASSSALTVWQDASADGTSSATALTITIPASNKITQEISPRLITAAGYEPADRLEFLSGDSEAITLRPLQGVVLFISYVLATQNPITDMWAAAVTWDEWTAA